MTVHKLAKKVAKIAREDRPEKKYIDVFQTTTSALSNTGTITYLSGIAAGTGESQRIGAQVRFKSLLMRWKYNGGTVEASTPTTYLQDTSRIIIFRDESSQGGTPAVSDVLETNNYLAPLNDDNKLRFKILYDQTFSTGSGSGPITQCNKFFRKLNKISTYLGTGGGNTAAGQNQYYLLTIQDTTNTNSGLAYWIRMRYTDA